jgi:ASCH domain
MPQKLFAISLKQPWAALVVAGVKTVEVRTWPTRRRGRVLIHAAKSADDRPEGWALVNTPELKELAALRGGVIGVVELTACLKYRTAEAFAAAAGAHHNAPDWFRAGLHGFVFQNPRPIAYHACPGRTLFFTVEGITLP